ncbi:hypothetical protein MTO96_024156 [Rhipicephalus appendiculatus]
MGDSPRVGWIGSGRIYEPVRPVAFISRASFAASGAIDEDDPVLALNRSEPNGANLAFSEAAHRQNKDAGDAAAALPKNGRLSSPCPLSGSPPAIGSRECVRLLHVRVTLANAFAKCGRTRDATRSRRSPDVCPGSWNAEAGRTASQGRIPWCHAILLSTHC